jgi:hypothetical protein
MEISTHTIVFAQGASSMSLCACKVSFTREVKNEQPEDDTEQER